MPEMHLTLVSDALYSTKSFAVPQAAGFGMDFLQFLCPRCNPSDFLPADRVNHHEGSLADTNEGTYFPNDVFAGELMVFAVMGLCFNLQCFYLLQRSVPSW